MATVSPPTTPKSSRPFLGRLLRSHMQNRRSNEVEKSKILKFFNINRKRLSPSSGDKEEVTKKRRGIIITDAHAETPAEPYPSSPLPTYASPFDDVDCGPSPPKRPRLPTPLGVFDVLGEFERFDFMASLSMSFFAKLALTSREWSQNIINYIGSNSWKRRFITSANNYDPTSQNEDAFAITGQLLKSVTISKLTAERIKFALRFVESVYADITNPSGWFRFFNHFCHCWASHEKMKVAKAIKAMNGGKVDKLIKVALASRHGEKPEVEMELRRLIHAYFVHPLLVDSSIGEKMEAGFWLSCVLKGIHSVGMQGRMCMILFAPLMTVDGKEQINWRTLVDDVVVSAQDAYARLGPLATGMSALISSKEHKDPGFSWKQDEIFNLIEEITTFPDPWSFDNFVSFLIQQGSLLPIAVCTRINHNHREEAGQIINTMKTLMHRWGIDTTAALGRPFRYVMSSLNTQQKESFVISLVEAHLSQCREYLLMGHAGATYYQEETLAQVAFAQLFGEAVSQIR